MKKLVLALLISGCAQEYVIDETPGHGGIIRTDGNGPTLEFANEMRAYRHVINLINCECGFKKLCEQALLTRESPGAFRQCLSSAVWGWIHEPDDQVRVLKCYQRSFKTWVQCLGKIDSCSDKSAKSIATTCYNERINWISNCEIEDIWDWEKDKDFEETMELLAID